jgi:uncharacterized protein (UPF0333 family)
MLFVEKQKQKKSLWLSDQRQRGQIVVEYILLLSIAVTIAMVIVSKLVKRDMDDTANSGAIIQKWREMQDTIANDIQN